MDLYTIETEIMTKFAEVLTDSTGYQGELPAFTEGATPNIFAIAMGDGGEPIQVASDEAYFAIEMNVRFMGVYGSREKALDDVSLLWGLLPFDDADIDGIQRLQISNAPTIQRAVLKRDNDQDTGGGEQRVWAVDMQMLLTVEV